MRQRLDGVAVLDPDEISCAQELQRQARFCVIVGEEIDTLQGGIAGLFLRERVPPKLSATDTIDRIHDQGGLVMIPHPLARGTPGKIQARALEQILDRVDIIEGYNARTPLAQDDRAARHLARQHGLPVSAGSDAHFGFEVGRAWVEMSAFRSPAEFLSGLHHARLRWIRKTPYWVSGLTVISIPALTLWRRYSGRRGSD